MLTALTIARLLIATAVIYGFMYMIIKTIRPDDKDNKESNKSNE